MTQTLANHATFQNARGRHKRRCRWYQALLKPKRSELSTKGEGERERERARRVADELSQRRCGGRIPAQTARPRRDRRRSRLRPSVQIRTLRRPRETISAASKECQEEAPRWWKRGVITSPFRRCMSGDSLGPERIRSSDRFFWKVWMTLVLGQGEMGYGGGGTYEA